MKPLARLDLQIAGPGLVVYSPFAMRGVVEGDNFLERNYTEPADVATHVRDGTLAGVCTGSPGNYQLELVEGALDLPAIAGFPFLIRLALEVRDRTVCIRDLYDFSRWKARCPIAQTLTIDDGFYRLTLGTRPTNSGIVGDDQDIIIAFEPVAVLPTLTWEGVPFLGDDEDNDE